MNEHEDKVTLSIEDEIVAHLSNDFNLTMKVFSSGLGYFFLEARIIEFKQSNRMELRYKIDVSLIDVVNEKITIEEYRKSIIENKLLQRVYDSRFKNKYGGHEFSDFLNVDSMFEVIEFYKPLRLQELNKDEVVDIYEIVQFDEYILNQSELLESMSIINVPLLCVIAIVVLFMIMQFSQMFG